jgi:catechol 2,3-dioxygenase-like lactoylglutathione lyase family enzyme
MRLGHVVLLVRDLDEMMSFYEDAVGLQVSDIGTAGGRPGGPAMGFMSWDPSVLHHQVALLEVGREPTAPRNVHHFAFEVDDLDALREAWKRVKDDPRAGGLDPGVPGPVTAFQADQWGIRFADPEGNGVEIYTPTPWDARAASAPYTDTKMAFESFDLGQDDENLLAWGAKQVKRLEHWDRGTRPRADLERRGMQW